jgi:hypothetical protein
VAHNSCIIHLAVKDQDKVGRGLRAPSSPDEVDGGLVGMGVLKRVIDVR